MSKKPTKAPPSHEESWRGVEANKMEVIGKIIQYFEYGISIQKAVNAYNVKTRWKEYISPLTIVHWYTEDAGVRELIDAVRETPEILSHETWIKEIKRGNYTAAKEWLQLHDKENFGDLKDPSEKMIIEFQLPPSPFIVKPKDAPIVENPPILKQSARFARVQQKKKPVRRGSKKGSTKNQTSTNTAKGKSKPHTEETVKPKPTPKKK